MSFPIDDNGAAISSSQVPPSKAVPYIAPTAETAPIYLIPHQAGPMAPIEMRAPTSMASMLSQLLMSDAEHERWALITAQIRHGSATLIGSPDNQYSMFREEDTMAWIVFTAVIGFFIIFDVFVLNRKRGKTTLHKAFAQTAFWMLCAVAFSFYVGHYRGLNVLSGLDGGGHDNAAHIPGDHGSSGDFSKEEIKVYDNTASNVQQTWFNGYLLEWMLSYDNIFGFHMIFRVYATPDDLKPDALTYGIVGAILLRLAFLWVGEWAMHALWGAHICFGLILVYTGVDGLINGEEDQDPTEHWMVKWLQSHLRLVAFYDKSGRFFVKVPIDEDGKIILPPMKSTSKASNKHNSYDAIPSTRTVTHHMDSPTLPSVTSKDTSKDTDSTKDSSTTQDIALVSSEDNNESDDVGESIGSPGSVFSHVIDSSSSVRSDLSHVIDTVNAFDESRMILEDDSSKRGRKIVRYEWRATLLFLVVCCLEITDLLFAIDSVSAIVAQVSDLFLAYTSVIFAMLGIRATFFIIEVLAHLFSLLKYGVAIALIFIGCKLIASKVIHISAGVVCGVLFGIVIVSMLLSVVKDWYLHQGLYYKYYHHEGSYNSCKYHEEQIEYNDEKTALLVKKKQINV